MGEGGGVISDKFEHLDIFVFSFGGKMGNRIFFMIFVFSRKQQGRSTLSTFLKSFN